MTKYEIYVIITTILFSLALLILAYDMGCRIRPPYNRNFGLIRFIVAVMLMIGAIYTAGQIDNAKEQQNAKESNQHFEIERQDEKYITKFQQEFLQNIIDVQTKNTKLNEIPFDLNNDFTISTKLVKEANCIENQWIVNSWK